MFQPRTVSLSNVVLGGDILEVRSSTKFISSLVNSQFFPFFILSGNAGSRTITTTPTKIAMTPSIKKSHDQGERSLCAKSFPMAYAIKPLKAPESVAVEKMRAVPLFSRVKPEKGILLTTSGRDFATGIPEAVVNAGVLGERLGTTNEYSSGDYGAIVLRSTHATEDGPERDASSTKQPLRWNPSHENRARKHADGVSDDCNSVRGRSPRWEIHLQKYCAA